MYVIHSATTLYSGWFVFFLFDEITILLSCREYLYGLCIQKYVYEIFFEYLFLEYLKTFVFLR